MRAAWLPGERDDGAAVAVSWGEPDPGVADLGCADEFVQGDPVGLRDRQEQLEAGPALAGFQPGQGALGDPGRGGQLGQGDAPLGPAPSVSGPPAMRSIRAPR